MEFTGDLRKSDYRGQDLRGALFHDADLCQACFAEAKLEDAFFLNCLAAEANFEKADAPQMTAADTNFFRATFRGAALREAHLYRCILAGADLRGADLKRITLTLDCNSFEEAHLDRAAGAELAYLFGLARTPQRGKWRELLGARDLVWLQRLFAR